MAKIERTWQEESLHEIDIVAHDCKVDIQGIDGNQVELKGDFSDHRSRELKLDCSGEYLKIHTDHSQFSLNLPKHKFWLISIFSGQGEIKARYIQARMRIMLGHGDIQVEDYRGWLAVGSGHGNLQLKHFIQIETEMPDFDSPSHQQIQGNDAGSAWDRFRGIETDIENWGEEIGEKIGWWALDLGRFFDRAKFPNKDICINLQTGDGNVEMEDIVAKTSILKLGRGNLKLKDINVANLVTNLTNGNVECQSALPSGDWMIKTARGNVQLSLPSNIGVRLDMATRNGNIESEIPLVRVARQGPESYSGMRMVGATGSGEGSLPELQISAVHGNIKIESEPPINKPFIRPAAEYLPSAPPEVNKAHVPLSPEKPDKSSSAEENGKGKPVSAGSKPEYDTQLVILKALREGQISVTEADQLLRTLGS